MRIEGEVEDDGTRERGDVAVVRAHSSGTVTHLQRETTTSVEHRELFVLRRSIDGWRITDYMYVQLARSHQLVASGRNTYTPSSPDRIRPRLACLGPERQQLRRRARS
jgi:hypothetical protein